MSLFGRGLLLVLALGASCAPRGCGGNARELEEILLERVPIADKEWEGILIELGSPSALPFLEDGWSYGEGSFRWAVTEKASLRVLSPREGTFLAFFECEPFRYAGSPAQWVGVVANGVELPPVELQPRRARYPVQLPLIRGENRIELRFRYAGDRRGGVRDKRDLAAAFYRLEIPFDDWSHRVGPFAWVEPEEGEPGVFLPAEGRLSFFLDLPAGSRLHLAAGAEDPIALRASPGASVSLTIRSDAGEIWAERFEIPRDAGGSSSWERELPAAAGPVEIRIAAGSVPLLVRPEIFGLREDVARETSAPSGKRPNIVVVVLDGANALRMSLYGSEKETTPVLDALGRESVVFDVAVSQAVYTIASIGSLLTGQYPDRHQSVSFADRLRDDVVTFPAILGAAGYRTAAFAGNAVVSKTFGLDRGYETFVPVTQKEGYTGHGDSVVREFRDFVESSGDAPYLAYVHFREPHFPYDPPPPFDTRFGPDRPFPGGLRDAAVVDELNDAATAGDSPPPAVLDRIEGLYHGNLAYADALVGEVVELVDESTIVIVTSDHGEALLEHGFLGHNTQLYEESIRVPLLIRAPGSSPRRVPDVVQVIDLTPTILELANLGAREAMQGRSLLPALSGLSLDERLAFTRTVWERPRYSVRGERWKLIWDSRTGASELYDLETDPGERENLAGRNALREGVLREELFRWYLEQERLKSKEPPPGGAVISEREREMLDSLGYANQVPQKKRDETDR